MKSFKAFFESMEDQPKNRFAIKGKNVNFRGPTQLNALGGVDGGKPETLIFQLKKKRKRIPNFRD